MVVNSSNPYVRNYNATAAGAWTTSLSDSPTAKTYVMTMKFGPKTAKEFNAGWKVRAYAKLSDGTYVYTNSETYTIYSIAHKLYQDGKMNNQAAHDYLYTDILSVVNPAYQKKNFNLGNAVVYIK